MSQTINRKCPKCNEIKLLSEFPPRKGAKDGIRNRCRACTQLYQYTHKHKNKEYYDKYWREYFKNRLKTDRAFKLKHFLRKTINRAFFQKKPNMRSMRLVGCTIDELIAYLEIRFQSGMSWNNHGKWHIDHIKPLSKFDLTKKSEVMKACHFTNLQPLWAKDNMKKSDKF